MNKVKVYVSENAKTWIERFQEEDSTNIEIAAIQRVVSYVINNWVDGLCTDVEAKDILTTLNNVECIIKSLGEECDDLMDHTII